MLTNQTSVVLTRTNLKRSEITFVKRFLIILIAISVISSPAQAQIVPDFAMDSDPEIPAIEWVRRFNPDYISLWQKALERPEADLQRMAAESIATAVEKQVSHLQNAIPLLEKIVSSDVSHPAARFAAARALVALNSQRSADQLLMASKKYGAELRDLVEPALADWDFAPVREVWSDRLNQPTGRSHDLILAIRGFGRVRDITRLPKILAIVLDLVPPAEVRLAAAEAAGLIVDSGLELHARRLMREARTSVNVNRFCALKLLSRHDSDAARQILTELATDDEPAIAGHSLERLNQIDPNLVIPLAQRSFKSADVFLREQAATAYLMRPTVERIQILVPLIDDPDPGFRGRLCEQLNRLSGLPEFGDTVRGLAMDVMSRDSWRGQEQAALLLGAQEYTPASTRLLELLESARPEVAIAAAWSLRKIADPKTISGICDKLRRDVAQKSGMLSHQRWPGFLDAHLFEACGKMQVLEAKDLMLKYVPKGGATVPGRARAAAVWALGRLQEGKLDQRLAESLINRFRDRGSIPPEDQLFQEFCAVTLARMKAVEFAEDLIQRVKIAPTEFRVRWAVKQLTGEDLPLPDPLEIVFQSPFLEPLDSSEPR